MRRGERPFLQLPPMLLSGFALLLIAQLIAHHIGQQAHNADYRGLSKPLAAQTYKGMAMGSEQLASYLLAIRLQMHDNQAGRHFRYSLIDYDLLVDWLDQISDLNLDSEYPMLLASRVYSQTSDHRRLRLLLDFIEKRFEDNPQLHWRRMTEASLIAKHQLEDLPLALRIAEKLASQPDSVVMPAWARDMHFLLLAKLNEFESAIAIIQALLVSKSVQDPDEERFLREKLLDFQQKLFESQQNPETPAQ